MAGAPASRAVPAASLTAPPRRPAANRRLPKPSKGAATAGRDATAPMAEPARAALSQTRSAARRPAVPCGCIRRRGVDQAATATTAAGQLAIANSSATGSSGTTATTAVTGGGSFVSTVSAFAQAQVGSAATSQSRADLGSAFGFNGTNNNAYAFATENPSAG